MNAATKATAKGAGGPGGLRQALSGFWNERNQRERRMLLAAAAVVVLGLVYALLLDPALSGRDDLQKRLPALRQQAAEVQALAKQAAAAPATASAAAPAPQPMTRDSLEAAAARRGIKAQNLSVTGELAKAQFNGVSFSALVEWLAEIQGARVSVIDANIEAQAQPDVVNASLTLRQQRGEPAR